MSDLGIEPGTSCTVVWCVTSRSARQLNVVIVVELFNCVNVMHRNVNKQNHLRTTVLRQSLQYLTCMDNYTWRFLILTVVRFFA